MNQLWWGFLNHIYVIAKAVVCQSPDPVRWKCAGLDAAKHGCTSAIDVNGTVHKFAS